MKLQGLPFFGLLSLLAVTSDVHAMYGKPKRTAPAAQSENLATEAKVEPESIAHLRIWKVSDDPAALAPLVRCTLVEGAKKATTVFRLQGGRYDFTNYSDTLAGAILVEVAGPDDKEFSAPTRAQLFLRAGAAATVLVHQPAAAAITAEVIDDANNGTGDLTIYNFLPTAMGDSQISMGDSLNVKLAPDGGSLRVRGLGHQMYPVSASVRNVDGRTNHWNAEIDFRAYHRASLMLCVDSYDRVRTRVFPDETAAFSSSKH